MSTSGHTDYLSSGFSGSGSNPGAIAIGFYNGMWAYDGWNNLNYVTEEIINPHRYSGAECNITVHSLC